jgi:hypothetical protein
MRKAVILVNIGEPLNVDRMVLLNGVILWHINVKIHGIPANTVILSWLYNRRGTMHLT